MKPFVAFSERNEEVRSKRCSFFIAMLVHENNSHLIKLMIIIVFIVIKYYQSDISPLFLIIRLPPLFGMPDPAGIVSGLPSHN